MLLAMMIVAIVSLVAVEVPVPANALHVQVIVILV
jgi:hypothetical protein